MGNIALPEVQGMTTDYNLPASPFIHYSLETSRSCLVTIQDFKQGRDLVNDVLDIRGGQNGRAIGRLGVLFLSASGVFYGDERGSEQNRVENVQDFTTGEDASTRLMIIKGMDSRRRQPLGSGEVIQALTEVVNKPGAPMLLALCTGQWRVGRGSGSEIKGTPDDLLGRISSAIELDWEGVAISCLGEPRKPFSSQRSILRNLVPYPGTQLEVPAGYQRLP